MFNRHTVNLGFGWITLALAWAMTSTNAMAQCGGHGGMGGHDHGAAGAGSHSMHSEQQHHSPNGGVPPLVQHTPHGGLFLEAEMHRLEVVYWPQETRVYLFGKSMEPLSTLALRGDMSLQIQGESSPRRIPLQYAPPRSPKDQDYLVAAADMARLPNETPVNFRFDNLPDRRHPRAEFTPIFAQSHIRPFVAQASFVQADREGLARQQVCPVTGARLGSMGAPIKVLVGDRPLYLCCAGCIEKVKETRSMDFPSHAAQSAHSSSACSNTVRVASSRRSGG